MEAQQVTIKRINTKTIQVPIISTAPLIVHRFSEKAKRAMLDAMQGRKTPRENKDPEAEYLAAFYRFADEGYGFPSIAFKSAIVGAARYFGKDVKMTELKQFIFVDGELGCDLPPQKLVRIEGEPVMREDVVTVGRGGTDLRYRPMFSEWHALLTVIYTESQFTLDSVLSLVDAGGLGVGVGEWRPQRNGDFGTYKVDTTKKVEVIG